MGGSFATDGSLRDTEGWPSNPDAAMVDTGICVKAPLRIFRSGIAGALATESEEAHVLGTRLADFPRLRSHTHGEKISFGIVTRPPSQGPVFRWRGPF